MTSAIILNAVLTRKWNKQEGPGIVGSQIVVIHIKGSCYDTLIRSDTIFFHCEGRGSARCPLAVAFSLKFNTVETPAQMISVADASPQAQCFVPLKCTTDAILVLSNRESIMQNSTSSDVDEGATSFIACVETNR